MILVSGATGKIGTELVAQLQAQRLPFRALAHTPTSYQRLREQGVNAVLVPEARGAELAAAFDDVDRFFLLAPGAPDQAATERAYVDGAKKAGVEHVVKLSVFGVDSPALSMFRAHHESEQYIEQSGIAYTFLRPNSFMQNLGARSANLIKHQWLITNSVGDGAVSFIDTRDIAAVALAILRDGGHGGQVYTLTGPQAVTYAQVAETLTSLLRRPVEYVAVDDEAYRASMVSSGVPAPLADGYIELYRHSRDGKAAVVTHSVEQLTGQSARTFATYLADHRALFE